jgi:spermidine/putrescine transport system substrate-binding protein
MSRRSIVLLLFMFLFPLLLVAQDAESTPEATVEFSDEPWVCPEGFEGQQLNVYNWSTYIAETTIPQFEEACGVTVQYDNYASNEDLLAQMRQGNPGYDVIFPGSYILPVMVREELVETLDSSLIPNLANVRPEFQSRPYDPDNTYSIPYLVSSLGVGYNTEIFPDGITSWEQVWQHDGPVAWIDDPRVMLGIALNILGYDANSENPNEITEAKDYLLANGGNVVAVAADDGQAQLQRGDVDVAIEYNGDIVQIIAECECETFAYAIPDEGTNYEIDAVAIPVGAQNIPLAHAFMDFILSAQAAADIANYTGYGSTNQAAIDLGFIDPIYFNDPAIYPPAEVIENLFLVDELSPEAESLYLDAWDEILITLGQ